LAQNVLTYILRRDILTYKKMIKKALPKGDLLFIFPLMKHIETNEELEQMMYEKNMSCGEVMTLTDLAYDISQFEQDNSITPLADCVLLHAWYSAADTFVDSMAENARDTPLSDFYAEESETALEVQEAQIASFEAMRPRTKRIAHITNLTPKT
jgi:hypothetical protein